MSSISREEYLKFRWKPYPKAPADIIMSGRLLAVEVDRRFMHVKVEKNNMTNEYSVEDKSLAEVLRPGDLIVVDSKDQVHLLVPGQLVETRVAYDTLKKWQIFVQAVRDYFAKEEFLEVTTPTLVVCPGTEPTLDVFTTELRKGSQKKELYLPTSPELHLKKALVLGFDKIFEVKNCFRNSEFSEHHQPEFTMLEWYRSYADLTSIEKDIVQMFQFIYKKFPHDFLFWPQAQKTFTVAELFRQHLGVEITPKSSLEDYQDLCLEAGVDVRGAESIDDYFFALMVNKIEPALPKEQLVFVKDYPPFQAALARMTDEGWADRMEVYFAGFELANGFHELNDHQEQKRRFQEDIEKKTKNRLSEVPLDQDFLSHLEKGMPPSAGIALGLERLFMAFFQIDDIRKTKLFPYGKD